MRRWAAGAAAIGAVLLSAGPAGAEIVEQPMLFGISDGSSVFPYEGSASAEQIAALESGAGAEAGRLTVRWEEIQAAAPPEVGPPHYDWSKVDELAEAQREQGVKPLPMLLGAPAWARVPGCSGVCPPAPEHLADWRAFVAAAAARYRDGAALEIWNEPNLTASWAAEGGPDPAAFAELFGAALEAAERPAPKLPILVGGLAYVEAQAIAEGSIAVDEYLTGFYAAGGADGPGSERVGIGLHVYPSPGGGNPDGRVTAALEQTREAIAAVEPLPDAVTRRIWVTEFGASTTAPDATTGAAVTLDLQEQLILQTLTRLENQPDVAAAILYTLVDRPPATGEAIGEEGFGVIGRGPDFTPKPAYCALAERAGRELPEGCPTG